MTEQEAIQKELNEIQGLIKDIKPKFKELKKKKEDYYSDGEKINSSIELLYTEVSNIEKDNNLDKVNEELNSLLEEEKSLKSKIDEINKKMVEVSKDTSRPVIKTVSVAKLKKEIQLLEDKLQIEVLSLIKEQEMIMKIKSLKDEANKYGSDASKGLTNNPKVLSREIFKYQRQVSAVERKIRSIYKQIRLISKQKKQRYKDIDVLKNKRKESFENFRKSKKDYSVVSTEIKELFKKEESLLEKLGQPIPKKSSFVKINEKRKEIEDKLKRGTVFTTEDLLQFQSLMK